VAPMAQPAPRAATVAEPAPPLAAQPIDAGKQTIPAAAGPRKPTKPSAELYFAESDDDELLLTLQANDQAAPVAVPQMPPLRAPHRLAAVGPTALADEPLLRADPAMTNADLANDAANVTVVRPADTLHPSWQHPAATLDSETWPSISKGGLEPAGVRAEGLAAGVTISGQSPGTAAPSRRSWWRRSFSRGK